MARTFLKTTGDYLTAAGAGVTRSPLTMACFVRVDALQFHAAVSLDNGGSHAYFLGVNNNGNAQAQVNAPGSGGFAQAVSTGSVSASTWHHIAAVYRSDSSREAFVDGGGKGVDTTTVTPMSMSRTELGRVAGFVTYLDGALAEVAIWNAALSGVEIRRLAMGWSSPTVRPDALVFYAPLEASEDFDVVQGRVMTVGAGSPGVRSHPPTISWPESAAGSMGRAVVDMRGAGVHRRLRRFSLAFGAAPSLRTVILDDAVMRVPI